MGESKGRLGRTYGYRLGIGSAVTAIALVMILSPLGGATVVVHAPYKGGVSTGFYNSVSGCAKAKVVSAAKFSLLTGKGGLGVTNAVAKVCKSSFGGIGSSSYGDAQANMNVAIKLHPSSGYHTINANANAIWSASDHFTQGTGCPAPKPFSYAYYYNYGTYQYWYNDTGSSSYCDAYASVYAYLEEAYIKDITNGSQISASSGCLYSFFCDVNYFNNYSENYTSTGWEFVHDTIWNGTAFSYYNYTYSQNYSYHTPGTSFSGSGSTPSSIDFNYTYVGSHQYALVLYFYSASDTGMSGWTGAATAAASGNVGTLGNGFTLNNILIS